jgi:hypothetical protein
METPTNNPCTDVYTCSASNALKIWRWLTKRGGIAVWRSVNLSNPGASWTTPAFEADGVTPYTKPTWQADNKPERIITDPALVMVQTDREVRRFRVGVRVGGSGMQVEVTDAGSRKIRAAVAKAGVGSYHQFGYTTQEAVIMTPSEKPMMIKDWVVRARLVGEGDSVTLDT